MKKKTLLVSTLIATTVLLTSCGSVPAESKAPLTGEGSTVSETKEIPKTEANTTNETVTPTTGAGATATTTEKKKLPTVYVVDGSESMKKTAPEGLVFLDAKDEVSVKIKELMKKEAGKEVVLEPTAEAVKQGIKSLTVKVWEYSPLFVFDAKTPDFDFDRINKENPTLIYTVDTAKGKFFAFKDPSFLGSGKEKVIFDDEMTNTVISNTVKVSEGKGDSRKVIMVEDPLCPYCAKKYLEGDDTAIMDKYQTNILWLPLPIPGHENSPKIISFMYQNLKDGKLDKNLVKAIFEKQTELTSADIKNGETIKKILETSSYKSNVKSLKGGDLDKSSYSGEAVNTIASSLGVTGTPTTFFYEGNTFNFFATLDELNK